MASIDALLFRDSALTRAFDCAFKSKNENPLVNYDGHTWQVVGISFKERGKIAWICSLFERIMHVLRYLFSLKYTERFHKIRQIFEHRYSEHATVEKKKSEQLTQTTVETPAQPQEPFLPKIVAFPLVEASTPLRQETKPPTIHEKNFDWIAAYEEGDVALEGGAFDKPTGKQDYSDELQRAIVKAAEASFQTSLEENVSFVEHMKFIEGLNKLRKNWTLWNKILREGLSALLTQCEKNLKREAITKYRFGLGYYFVEDHEGKEERLILTKSQTSKLTKPQQNKIAVICKELIDQEQAEINRGQLFSAINQLLLYAQMNGYDSLRVKLMEILNYYGKLDSSKALAEAQRNHVARYIQKFKILLEYQPTEQFVALSKEQLIYKKTPCNAEMQLQIAEWLRKHLEEFWKFYDKFSVVRGSFLDIAKGLYKGLQQIANDYGDDPLAGILRPIYDDLKVNLKQRKAELELKLKQPLDVFDLLKTGETQFDPLLLKNSLVATYGQALTDQAIAFVGLSPTAETVSRITVQLMMMHLDSSLSLKSKYVG